MHGKGGTGKSVERIDSGRSGLWPVLHCHIGHIYFIFSSISIHCYALMFIALFSVAWAVSHTSVQLHPL